MISQISVLIRECYKLQLNSLYLTSLYKKTNISQKRLLCKNETDYMSETKSLFMNILIMMKTDQKLFGFFVNQIEQDTSFDANFLYTLAEDLVNLLFIDFAGNETCFINSLFHFEYLFNVFFG